jgi:glycosyltransferase involved in cell wall biosynthesis
VASLVRELARRGHEVHLAARPEAPVVAQVGGAAALHPLEPRGSLDPGPAFRISRIVREHGIDVVHCHAAMLLRACAWARAMAGGRLFYTAHHFRLRRHGPLYRRMVRRLDGVVAVSASMRDRILLRLGVDPDRVLLVPNWVDAGHFADLPPRDGARAALGATRPHVVGIVGSVIPVKGYEEFVRAAGRLAAERGDVEFVAVGLDSHCPPAFLRKLEALRARLGLEGRLRILPWQEDVRPVFAALTAIAVPSWNEAFSLVLVEAMAAGVPAVATAVGGPGEIVADGTTGLHVPPRDADALATALGRLLDDAPLRERLARNAREEARRYSVGPAVDLLEAIYRGAPARAAASGAAGYA